jgi:hypothetical protein
VHQWRVADQAVGNSPFAQLVNVVRMKVGALYAPFEGLSAHLKKFVLARLRAVPVAAIARRVSALALKALAARVEKHMTGQNVIISMGF